MKLSPNQNVSVVNSVEDMGLIPWPFLNEVCVLSCVHTIDFWVLNYQKHKEGKLEDSNS